MFFAAISLFLFTAAVTMILANVGLAEKISEAGIAGRTGEILDRTKILNDKISVMGKLQDKFTFFSDSLADLVKTVPVGVKVSELVFSKEGKGATVRGVAATREDLINFKKNLEVEGRFSEVEISMEDISSKELVSFEITAVVNFSKL